MRFIAITTIFLSISFQLWACLDRGIDLKFRTNESFFKNGDLNLSNRNGDTHYRGPNFHLKQTGEGDWCIKLL